MVERHYRIGAIPVTLRTRLAELRRDYASLYAHCALPGPPQRSIVVDAGALRPARRSGWLPRRRFDVTINGRTKFEPARRDALLPYVEWGVNFEIPHVLPRFLQFHASSMEVNGAGVVFPGASGSGKSTLTTGLVARGWRYLCDEFALVDTQTLSLEPFPRAICIKRASFPVLRSLGVGLHRGRRYIKGSKGCVGFVSPRDINDDAVGTACPIRKIVFPTYQPKARPHLEPLSRADAAFALHAVCFNLLKCDRLGLDVIAAVCGDAECYRLTSGGIHATCDVMDELMGR